MSNKELIKQERNIFKALRCSQDVLCSIIRKHGNEIRRLIYENKSQEYILEWLCKEIIIINGR